MSNTHGRTPLILLTLLSAVLLAAGDLFCLARVVQDLTGSVPPADAGLLQPVIQSLGQSFNEWPHFVAFLGGAPLLCGAIIALLVGRHDGAPAAAGTAAAAAAGSDTAADGALRLLALLQKEGRLVDFLEEDIEPYGDAQVGAAVRAIHSGCHKALHERMEITRVFPEDDGATVEVPTGFDPATVRLTGNVHGQPPFRGVLQHGGWRASQVVLPKTAGIDPTILAPAEVELA